MINILTIQQLQKVSYLGNTLQKKVSYLGNTFFIPEYYHYVAIDKNGAINAFILEPDVDIDYEIWNCKQSWYSIATCTYNGDWTKSLQKYD